MEEKRPKILFVDDDLYFSRIFLEALREHFSEIYTVDVCNRIEDAIGYVHRHPDVRAIVLDVMMPKPAGTEWDSVSSSIPLENGINTGVWFIEYMLSHLKSRDIKVFLFTHRDMAKVKTFLSSIGIDPCLHECAHKHELFADQLPPRVAALLNRRC